jgi:hypothetical protein
MLKHRPVIQTLLSPTHFYADELMGTVLQTYITNTINSADQPDLAAIWFLLYYTS